MEKIVFLLPTLNFSGGVKVITQIADWMHTHGYDVRIQYPWIPKFNTGRFNLPYRYHCDAPITPYMKAEKIEADTLVCTSWETVYEGMKIKRPDMKRFYYIQHYERWKMWNDLNTWGRAGYYAHEVPFVDVDDPELVSEREMVDRTYSLDLNGITTSLFLRDIIGKIGRQNTPIVPPGIKVPRLFKEFHRNPVVTAQIRPGMWKGAERALEWITELRKKYPEATYQVFGETKEFHIPNWINQFHKPSDDRLANIYYNTDVFLFTSWCEGFGLPPLEAMSYGSSVCSSPVGAVPEYGGNIIKDEDDIDFLMESKDVRIDLGMRGYERSKCYDLDITCKLFVEELNK